MSDAPPRASEFRTVDPCAALSNSLTQVGEVLKLLEADQYQSTDLAAFDSSIGAHVRHCLDHVQSLLDRCPERGVTYDRRRRGTAVETDLQVGREELARIARQGDALEEPLDAEISIYAIVTPDRPEQPFTSTLGRELLYVFLHTVHHLAIIRAQARSLGFELDPELGRAPATVAADRASRP